MKVFNFCCSLLCFFGVLLLLSISGSLILVQQMAFSGYQPNRSGPHTGDLLPLPVRNPSQSFQHRNPKNPTMFC